MKKLLKRIEYKTWYFNEDGLRIEGAPDCVSGDLSGVRGDLTNVRGDLTGVLCDLNGVRGEFFGVSGLGNGGAYVWAEAAKISTQPTRLSILGSCILGAIIGVMLSIAVLGGF